MPFRTPDDLVRDYAAINDAMRRVGQRENVGVIEVGNAIPGDKQHFTDSVHFNDAGSLMMADLVAAGLLRQVGSETIGGR
jgi:hypothetical protein